MTALSKSGNAMTQSTSPRVGNRTAYSISKTGGAFSITPWNGGASSREVLLANGQRGEPPRPPASPCLDGCPTSCATNRQYSQRDGVSDDSRIISVLYGRGKVRSSRSRLLCTTITMARPSNVGIKAIELYVPNQVRAWIFRLQNIELRLAVRRPCRAREVRWCHHGQIHHRLGPNEDGLLRRSRR